MVNSLVKKLNLAFWWLPLPQGICVNVHDRGSCWWQPTWFSRALVTSSRKGEWTWRCLEARGIRGPEEEEVVEGSEVESRSWQNIFSWWTSVKIHLLLKLCLVNSFLKFVKCVMYICYMWHVHLMRITVFQKIQKQSSAANVTVLLMEQWCLWSSVA